MSSNMLDAFVEDAHMPRAPHESVASLMMNANHIVSDSGVSAGLCVDNKTEPSSSDVDENNIQSSSNGTSSYAVTTPLPSTASIDSDVVRYMAPCVPIVSAEPPYALSLFSSRAPRHHPPHALHDSDGDQNTTEERREVESLSSGCDASVLDGQVAAEAATSSTSLCISRSASSNSRRCITHTVAVHVCDCAETAVCSDATCADMTNSQQTFRQSPSKVTTAATMHEAEEKIAHEAAAGNGDRDDGSVADNESKGVSSARLSSHQGQQQLRQDGLRCPCSIDSIHSPVKSNTNETVHTAERVKTPFAEDARETYAPRTVSTKTTNTIAGQVIADTTYLSRGDSVTPEAESCGGGHDRMNVSSSAPAAVVDSAKKITASQFISPLPIDQQIADLDGFHHGAYPNSNSHGAVWACPYVDTATQATARTSTTTAAQGSANINSTTELHATADEAAYLPTPPRAIDMYMFSPVNTSPTSNRFPQWRQQKQQQLYGRKTPIADCYESYGLSELPYTWASMTTTSTPVGGDAFRTAVHAASHAHYGHSPIAHNSIADCLFHGKYSSFTGTGTSPFYAGTNRSSCMGASAATGAAVRECVKPGCNYNAAPFSPRGWCSAAILHNTAPTSLLPQSVTGVGDGTFDQTEQPCRSTRMTGSAGTTGRDAMHRADAAYPAPAARVTCAELESATDFATSAPDRMAHDGCATKAAAWGEPCVVKRNVHANESGGGDDWCANSAGAEMSAASHMNCADMGSDVCADMDGKRNETARASGVTNAALVTAAAATTFSAYSATTPPVYSRTSEDDKVHHENAICHQRDAHRLVWTDSCATSRYRCANTHSLDEQDTVSGMHMNGICVTSHAKNSVGGSIRYRHEPYDVDVLGNRLWSPLSKNFSATDYAIANSNTAIAAITITTSAHSNCNEDHDDSGDCSCCCCSGNRESAACALGSGQSADSSTATCRTPDAHKSRTRTQAQALPPPAAMRENELDANNTSLSSSSHSAPMSCKNIFNLIDPLTVAKNIRRKQSWCETK